MHSINVKRLFSTFFAKHNEKGPATLTLSIKFQLINFKKLLSTHISCIIRDYKVDDRDAVCLSKKGFNCAKDGKIHFYARGLKIAQTEGEIASYQNITRVQSEREAR